MVFARRDWCASLFVNLHAVSAPAIAVPLCTAEELVSEALARHVLSLPADLAGETELGADIQIAAARLAKKLAVAAPSASLKFACLFALVCSMVGENADPSPIFRLLHA